MARIPIKPNTLRALFAKSGNICAYPGCIHELVNANSIFVAEVCHIEAAEPGGERYNSNQTDEQRRSFENLIILCHKHHVETDDVKEFTVDRLKEIKSKHESINGEKRFRVDESVIFQIESEMQKYWVAIERANKEDHIAPDIAIDIGKKEPNELFDAFDSALRGLGDFTETLRYADATLSEEIRVFLLKLGYDLDLYDSKQLHVNPFSNRNWETHHLGIPNRLIELSALILQFKVVYWEEYIKTHSTNDYANLQLKTAKSELLKRASSGGYYD